MKLRNGFVSNSSSSSFIIFGMHVSKENYEYLREKYEDVDWNDGALSFYDSDTEGFVVGKDAIPYLEQQNIPDSKLTALSDIMNSIDKNDFLILTSNDKISLIYDSYYC